MLPPADVSPTITPLPASTDSLDVLSRACPQFKRVIQYVKSHITHLRTAKLSSAAAGKGCSGALR